MRRTVSSVRSAGLVRGLAAKLAPTLIPVLLLGAIPAQAQAQQQTIQPSNTFDYSCIVALQQRRQDLLQDNTVEQSAKIDIFNNLTIISAFYAGRLTHYPSDTATEIFSQARREHAPTTDVQRDEQVQQCANFYLSVMQVLDGLQGTSQ